MLIEQAVLQVRIFTDADPDTPLPREDEVRGAMRAAVGRWAEPPGAERAAVRGRARKRMGWESGCCAG